MLRNEKKFLPTYALWFEFSAGPVESEKDARPETTLTAKGIDVWEAISRAEKAASAGAVHLRTRLDPGGRRASAGRSRPRTGASTGSSSGPSARSSRSGS